MDSHTCDAGCRVQGTLDNRCASNRPRASLLRTGTGPTCGCTTPDPNTRSLLGLGTRSFLHTTTPWVVRPRRSQPTTEGRRLGTTYGLSNRGRAQAPSQRGIGNGGRQSRPPCTRRCRGWCSCCYTPALYPTTTISRAVCWGKTGARSGTRAVVGLAGGTGPVGVTPAEGLRPSVADAEAIVAARRLTRTVRCLAQPPIKKSVELIHRQQNTSNAKQASETHGFRRRNRPSQPGTRSGVT